VSVPRTVAEVLSEHVTLEVEGIDRMYLNVYMSDLQREQGSRLVSAPSSGTPVRVFRAYGSDQQSLRRGH